MSFFFLFDKQKEKKRPTSATFFEASRDALSSSGFHLVHAPIVACALRNCALGLSSLVADRSRHHSRGVLATKRGKNESGQGGKGKGAPEVG